MLEIWPPGRWKREGKAKPAIEVIAGSEAAKPAIPESGGHPNFNLNTENLSPKGKATATSKPAIAVITDFGVGLSGKEPENSKVVGMRKLLLTAAEELLEIIMRRYERASTMITSNRPVDDWGKLLGNWSIDQLSLDCLIALCEFY